jgi:glycosyltransferase involved in cell wall biosynthesis
LATVSVVTPVYNGEKYLKECIQSVISQTFQDWEYVICDNGSTDGTPDILKGFSKDPRIRVFVNPRTLPVTDSFNHAASLVSRDAKYLKFLCADDVLFPSCLELMVGVAQANPEVRLVGSYKIEGERAVVEGPPFPQVIVSGKEVCQWFFQGRKGILGSETSHLIRLPVPMVDGVLFDPRFPKHSDTELFIRLLKGPGDFGFVHQVLTFTREHEGSVSSTQAQVMGTGLLEYQAIIRVHGKDFLPAKTLGAVMTRQKREYGYYIFRSLVSPNRKKVLDYHRSYWSMQGTSMTALMLARTMLLGAVICLARPGDVLLRLRRKVHGMRGKTGGSQRETVKQSGGA